MTQLSLKLDMRKSTRPTGMVKADKPSVRRSLKTVETLKCTVYVIKSDIDGGIRCDANRCMHKVAIARTLSAKLRVEVSRLRVRVDAAGISFHYKGYRWHAVLPRKVKNTLIAYDNPKTRDSVRPHTYTFHATRGRKIIPISPERQEQMYEAQLARAAAAAAGADMPQKTRHRSLRSRIIGLQ